MELVRRSFATCAVMLAALAAAATSSAQSIEAQQSHLRSFVCQRAPDPGERAVSITAVMRPITGTSKMQMRFELMRRPNVTAKPVSIAARGLRTWLTPSDPTIGQNPGDRWVVQHPVVDLAGPDLYRFKVSFRWFDSQGNVLGSIVRRSRTCYQPEPRADLTIPALKIVPLSATSDRYDVVVANRGRSAAGPFNVQLVIGSPPNQLTYIQTVTELAPRTRQTVSFTEPACTATEPITITADPEGVVDESNRANDTLSQTCPGTTTAKPARRRR